MLRLRTAPSDAELAAINADFADIIVRNTIARTVPSKAEVAEHDVPDLARIDFRFDRRSHARLRELINVLNALPDQPSPELA